MLTIAATKTAREYLRVSFDRSGRERSQDEQHHENTRFTGNHGWTLADPYRDTGSASRYGTGSRAGFDRLLDDMQHGRFDADVLVIWESSRGSRKVGEWVDLIEACERHGVQIAVTTHGRIYDPHNARDRRSLLEDAVDGEYEAAKVSERVTRTAASAAAAGQPWGIVPFGYRRIFDPTTGRLTGQEPDPHEAPIVAELFERVDRGESLGSVTRDLAARQVVGRRGRPMRQETVRDMLRNKAYIAVRVHKPRGGQASEYPATWEPLVSETVFWSVQRRLNDPARRTAKPGRGKHLLSFIAVCDVCDGGLSALNKRGRRRYQCHRSNHVMVDADELDDVATDRIIEALSTPEHLESIAPDTDIGGDDLDAARNDVARIRVELDELADQIGAGQITAATGARAEAGIVHRLTQAQARVDELVTPSALRPILDALSGDGAVDEIETRWQDLPLASKREAARLLLTPEWLGQLRIVRSTERGIATPTVDRVQWARW